MTTVSAPSLGSTPSSPVRAQKSSSVTIIRLVDSRVCSIPFLREFSPPQIILSNFDELIQPTPFKKYSSRPGSPKRASQRSISAAPTPKTLTRNPHELFVSRAKSNQCKPNYKTTQTPESLSPGLPKSRFFQEDRERQLGLLKM